MKNHEQSIHVEQKPIWEIYHYRGTMAVHSQMPLGRRSAAAVALGVGAMATVGFVAPQVWANPWGWANLRKILGK